MHKNQSHVDSHRLDDGSAIFPEHENYSQRQKNVRKPRRNDCVKIIEVHFVGHCGYLMTCNSSYSMHLITRLMQI